MQAADGQSAINVPNRIGPGPWYNAKGAGAAKNVAHLYSDTLEAARLGNNLGRTTVITEKNETVNGADGNTSWNSAHAGKGCGQENPVKTGGAGLFYCVAIN